MARKIFTLLLAGIFVCALLPACSDDDDNPTGSGGTTPDPATGIYAKLVVSRAVTNIGGLMRIDIIQATFDSAYAPCDPVWPMSTAVVSCEGYTLNWDANARSHIYPAVPNPSAPFLTLGDNYRFDVTAAGAIPALTDSIDFPDDEPYLLSPAFMATVSRALDMNLVWAGAGAGNVEIIMLSDAGDSTFFVETSNDGSYTVPAAQLSSYSPGSYTIILSHYNRELITATGYDSRSFIAGRVLNTTLITLQ